jgi:hypothetical protein
MITFVPQMISPILFSGLIQQKIISIGQIIMKIFLAINFINDGVKPLLFSTTYKLNMRFPML